LRLLRLLLLLLLLLRFLLLRRRLAAAHGAWISSRCCSHIPLLLLLRVLLRLCRHALSIYMLGCCCTRL
jgi:hypothetical protein